MFMDGSFLYPHFLTVQKIARRRHVKVFLVGGAVRDAVLGRDIRDLDFAVERGAVSFARMFSKDARGAFVLLDEEHGCARVVKKHNGLVYTFDFADFRAPTFKKDLLNRDFSINTLAVDMASWTGKSFPGRVIDTFSGKEDIQKGVIRMVFDAAFQQDPLRLMRAFSLRAALGFLIERATMSRIKQDRGLIRDVSAERVRDELFKILESSRAAVILKEMDRAGLLEHVIPQIRVMFGVPQGTYHHLDVWPHALESVKQLERVFREYRRHPEMTAYLNKTIAGNRSRRALLKLACLLHDIGKPETRKRDGERIRFHGHEHAGKAICDAVARHLKLSKRERHLLGDMVQMHLRPGYLSNVKHPSARAVFRYFRDAGEEAVSIALLARADQRATCGPMTTREDALHHDEVCLNLINRYFEQQKETQAVSLINGNDLIQILGLKPSPLFSTILKDVEEARATGRIKTKDQALDLARRIAGAVSPTEKSEGQ
jgi:putative nucleotidyltransferase with HDIG domain